mgnify:CR=1 FL=1
MDLSCKNQASLRGRAGGTASPSHTNHGVTYYLFPLEVDRLSGTLDTLNVVVSEDLLAACPVIPGEEYQVTGEVRSFNNRSGVGSRLVITFFARTLLPAQGEHANELELVGVLCKLPVVRRTPLGREICDLLLAVNRRYGRADYLPCIAWGSLARSCGELEVGDTVHMTGRLQSRKYRKLEAGREEERTAYEVSVVTLEMAEEPI